MLAHYTQAAMVAENRRLCRAREHRLAAHERDAGGPRLDGLGRRAQAARAWSRTSAASSPSSWPARRAALDLRAPLEPGPGTAPRSPPSGRPSPGPGPDRWLAPELAEAEALVASGAVLAAVEAAIGELE